MTVIRISGPGAATATTSVDNAGNLLITLADPPPPPAPQVVTESAAARAPLRIGYHPAPGEYKVWLPQLPTPWFSRVFHPAGAGLPVWGGPAINGLPTATIRHISFKDRVAPAIISMFLDSIPASVDQVWLTWHHEGDINWADDVPGYAGYWKLLRKTVDAHPYRPRVTLVNVHTQYASRYKRQAMDWRRFMLPDCADVDSWDCYRTETPDVYEAPETLLGLPLTARQEFGVRTHITEYGTHPTSWDKDGTAQATWYRESCQVMAAAGVEAVGFWCNIDGKREYRPTKPAVLEAWRSLITKYNSAA